ncbi:hypothetical protein MVEN_00849800 [Mycena venus]|uniref:Uncharacterized protein n=1 Tax=Mycena venus TaxID=2733690 RepID=A0A8H6YGB1_9AGAR|nr:hypothetical protein MVEN_00849800 [Mycena venus]
MPPLSSPLILVVAYLLHSALAQQDQGSGAPSIDGGQDSKVAITGAIIGGVLVVIALLAVGVYGIERCLSRRRAKTAHGRFAPLPTQAEDEPYRYLSLPPATRPANKDYGHGPFYPGSVPSPPVSPNTRRGTSEYGSAYSPARSPGARSVRFDPYGHGPFYPDSNAQRVSPLPSPLSPSFRNESQSQSTVFVASPETFKSTTPIPFSVRDDRPSMLSRTTSTTLGSAGSMTTSH